MIGHWLLMHTCILLFQTSWNCCGSKCWDKPDLMSLKTRLCSSARKVIWLGWRCPCSSYCSSTWKSMYKFNIIKTIGSFRIIKRHKPTCLTKNHHIYAGCWYTHPSDKYESQLGLLFPIYGKSKKIMFQTTNQSWYLTFRSVPQMAVPGPNLEDTCSTSNASTVATRARQLSLGELAFSHTVMAMAMDYNWLWHVITGIIHSI